MQTRIILLRGVLPTGANKVPMARLREVPSPLTAALALWLTACGGADLGSAGAEREPDAPRRTAPPASHGAAAQRPLLERTDSVVARLVAALRREDAAAIAALTRPPDTFAARAAMLHLRRELGGPVETWRRLGPRRLGESMLDTMHIGYELISTTGRAKPVVVYAGDAEYRPYDEFLSYSGRAEWLATAVVEAIRTRDAERLARLFSPDDIDYPVALAETVIARYAERFDLPTLHARFEGLAPPPPPDGDLIARVSRPFRYTVRGTKEGEAVAHEVRLVHGDGLVGWRDPLVPPPPS